MMTYILISVIIAFWIWYPPSCKEEFPEIKIWEWVIAFILTAILWPWFLLDYILKIFK